MRLPWMIAALLFSVAILASPARGTSLPAAGFGVAVTCHAPTSAADVIAGYNFYRSLSGVATYTLLNASPAASCAYTDSTAPANEVLDYVIESVDANGVTSEPSNLSSVATPTIATAPINLIFGGKS